MKVATVADCAKEFVLQQVLLLKTKNLFGHRLANNVCAALIFVPGKQYINQWVEKQEVAIVTLSQALIMEENCKDRKILS